MTLMWLGDIAPDAELARAASEEAVSVAERLRGHDVRYAPARPDTVVSESATALAALERNRSLQTAVEWQLRAVDVGERSGDRRLLASNLTELADLYLLGAEVDAADQAIRRAEELVDGTPSARVNDKVAVSRARHLHRTARTEEAAATARQVIATGLAAGRSLHVFRAACVLADVLLDAGESAQADAALHTAESQLYDSPDLRFVTAVRVRRARLLRLSGRPDDALGMLHQAETGLDCEGLTPEHAIWLVEHALLADDPGEARGWVERLEDLSRRTGIAIPPWERRLLADAGFGE
jgi:hypothetical protein